MKNTRRGIQGGSLIEVAVVMWIMLLCSLLLFAVMNFGNLVWYSSNGEEDSKTALYFAIEKMAPTIRNALRVDPSSGITKLTVVLPKSDGLGGYILPLADGDSISFYLSDATGNASHVGNILWRSLNGVPDESWALRGTTGAEELTSQTLNFAYTPVASPQLVTVTLSSVRWAGDTRVSYPASTEVYLRN